MITLIFMNLVVGTTAFLVNYKILRFPDFIDSLLSFFILYFAQIIVTELILGITGLLFIDNLILFNLVILFIIWFITRNKEAYLNFTGRRDVLSGFFRNKVILFLITVIAVFASVKIFINLVNPPFGWDNLNYHFTFPVEWLKHGNLENPITISDDFAPTYYPLNGSLIFLWFILPLKSVFLADLGQVPFFILAFLATYNIARKLSLNNESSFYGAAIFLLIPNFFKQLHIAYVDVMVAALFLSCLNYLCLLYREFSSKNLLIYSLSLGLLLGIKTIALPYGMLLFVPFILLALKNKQKRHLFIVSILIIISFGGFSYIRNFIETGNPFYPINFELFGQGIFKGVIDINSYRAHFKIEDYSLAKLLFHEGLGVQALVFILPAVFLALPLTLIRKKKIQGLPLKYILILPLLIYLIYRYVIPLANTRYLYPLFGMSIVIGFYTAEILNIPRRFIAILVAICALASITELAKRQELVLSAILTFLVFTFCLFFIKYIRQRLVIRKRLFIYLSLITVILILIFLEKDYIRNEYPRYTKMVKYSGFWPEATKAWHWLNNNTQNNNIAYVGRPVPFPLYGTNFKNNVYYVSVNKIDPAKLHYFPEGHYRWGHDFLGLHKNLEEEGNYRAGADYQAWLSNLTRRDTDYLFIYSLHQTKEIEFPVEDSWAKNNPDKFTPVFTSQTIHIYKVSR